MALLVSSFGDSRPQPQSPEAANLSPSSRRFPVPRRLGDIFSETLSRLIAERLAARVFPRFFSSFRGPSDLLPLLAACRENPPANPNVPSQETSISDPFSINTRVPSEAAGPFFRPMSLRFPSFYGLFGPAPPPSPTRFLAPPLPRCFSQRSADSSSQSRNSLTLRSAFSVSLPCYFLLHF